MAIIGFILLAAAAVFGIEIVTMNNVTIDVDAFNQLYETSVALVFVAGVVTGLAAALSVMLIRDGMLRRHHKRLEAKQAEEHRERHIAALEEEHAAYQRAGADGDGNGSEHIDLRDRVRDLEPDRDRVTTF
jgi:uncharacterized integral membrane protein